MNFHPGIIIAMHAPTLEEWYGRRRTMSESELRLLLMAMKRALILRAMSYEQYLDTPEWLSMRRLVLNRANYQCVQCGSTHALHVHHKTYERRGHEAIDDLEVRCAICHAETHGIQLSEQEKLILSFAA